MQKTEELVSTLSFDQIIKESSIKVWKLIDMLKFHLIFYKIITGKGLEFDRLREYLPNDDAKMIDWNSYARTTKLFVKVFKEERLLDALFVLDVSNTMLLGTTELTKNEYASILTTTLAYTSNLIGDRVGLFCFSDVVKKQIEPSMGIDSILEIAKALADKNTYGGVKNWEIIGKTVLENISSESYIFIISDFINSNEYTFDFISKCSSKFKKTLVVMVRDPIDSFIPKGIGYIYLADPDTGEVSLVNADKVSAEYNKKARREEMKIEKQCKNSGVEFIKVHTNEDFTDGLVRFMKSKVEEWS